MTDETTTAQAETEATETETTETATETVDASPDALRTKLGLSRKDVADRTGLSQAVVWRLGKLQPSAVVDSDQAQWTLIDAALRQYEQENPAGKPKAAPKTPKAPKSTGLDPAEVTAAITEVLGVAQAQYIAAKSAKKVTMANLTTVVDALIALKEKYAK